MKSKRAAQVTLEELNLRSPKHGQKQNENPPDLGKIRKGKTGQHKTRLKTQIFHLTQSSSQQIHVDHHPPSFF
jgi:hypothetical protein